MDDIEPWYLEYGSAGDDVLAENHGIYNQPLRTYSCIVNAQERKRWSETAGDIMSHDYSPPQEAYVMTFREHRYRLGLVKLGTYYSVQDRRT